MNKIFKKDVQKKITNQLKKYIDFKNQQYVIESNNQIKSGENEIVKNYQAEIAKISENYQSFCSNNFEAICLSIFILELSYLKRTKSWDITLNNDTKPTLNNGANELLKAIEAFGLNSQNIEEITIKTKHPDNYIKEKETNPNKTTKDPTGKHLNITGRIAINRIMNGISNEKAIKELQTIANSDMPEKKEPINFFKESAKALYPYLNKYFDHLPSENERYYLGAHLLDAVDIKPNYRDIAKLEQDENAYKIAMISNFKKAVKQ
jgi:hypothetical protein